jgi:hypothetical protein
MKTNLMTTSLRHIQSLAITGVAAFSLFSFGCATSTSPTQNGGAAPGGTLYFAEHPPGIEKLDLSSGVVTTIISGDMPSVRADGWILGVFQNNLGFVSPDGAQSKVILTRGNTLAGYDESFGDPRLSPDGRYIAYHQRFYDLVEVVDAATGASIVRIGDNSKTEYFGHPSWGKDGSLYVHAVPFNAVLAGGGIYKIDPAFTTITRVDQNLNLPTQPTVSPDGTTIAFILGNHLWTMGIDGSNPKRLTTSDGTESWPTWSPDSKWIAINNAACDVFLVPIAGGAAVDLGAKFPNSFGGGATHCPSSGEQMDWK